MENQAPKPDPGKSGSQSSSPQSVPVINAGGAVGVPSEEIRELDVESAPQVAPDKGPEVQQLPPLDKAGVDLAKWVLWMISVFVVISVTWAWTSEVRFSNDFKEVTKILSEASAGGTNMISKDVLEVVVQSRTEFRDFWLKIFQMVLLNVLLPVLTALLGYVFGSRRTQSSTGKE